MSFNLINIDIINDSLNYTKVEAPEFVRKMHTQMKQQYFLHLIKNKFNFVVLADTYDKELVETSIEHMEEQ